MVVENPQEHKGNPEFDGDFAYFKEIQLKQSSKKQKTETKDLLFYYLPSDSHSLKEKRTREYSENREGEKDRHRFLKTT